MKKPTESKLCGCGDDPSHQPYRSSLPPGTPPPATLDALLPSDVIKKLHDLWRITGTNLAYWALVPLIQEVQESNQIRPTTVLEHLEGGWFEQIALLKEQWDAETVANQGGAS